MSQMMQHAIDSWFDNSMQLTQTVITAWGCHQICLSTRYLSASWNSLLCSIWDYPRVNPLSVCNSTWQSVINQQHVEA